MLVCLMLTKSRSAWIGLLVGAAGARLAVARAALGSWRSGIGAAVLAVGLGGLVACWEPPSARHEHPDRGDQVAPLPLEYWIGTWGVITNAPNPFEPRPAGQMMVGQPVETPFPSSTFW